MPPRKDREARPGLLSQAAKMNMTTHFAAVWGLHAGHHDRAGITGEPVRFEYAELQDEAGREIAVVTAFTPEDEDGIEGYHALHLLCFS